MSYDYTRTIVISPRDTKIPIDLDLNKVIKLEWNNIKIPDVFSTLSNIPNLEDLVCSNSKITKLPDNMLNLINLNCSNNKITSLAVTNLTLLTNLSCQFNLITQATAEIIAGNLINHTIADGKLNILDQTGNTLAKINTLLMLETNLNWTTNMALPTTSLSS